MPRVSRTACLMAVSLSSADLTAETRAGLMVGLRATAMSLGRLMAG